MLVCLAALQADTPVALSAKKKGPQGVSGICSYHHGWRKISKDKKKSFNITLMQHFNANLFSSLPAFNRANGEAESGSTRDVWNVHVVVEPLVPPGTRKEPLWLWSVTLLLQSWVKSQSMDHYSSLCTTWGSSRAHAGCWHCHTTALHRGISQSWRRSREATRRTDLYTNPLSDEDILHCIYDCTN